MYFKKLVFLLKKSNFSIFFENQNFENHFSLWWKNIFRWDFFKFNFRIRRIDCSVSSSQGGSAPKWSKFQAKSIEMHQMNQKSSNYVTRMVLDARCESQDWNREGQVCNAVFLRSAHSAQKLKRYLLSKIFRCSDFEISRFSYFWIFKNVRSWK